MWMYVGTYTKAASRGIYGLELDESTGRFAEPRLMVETENPSFLAMNTIGDRLYATLDSGTFDGKPGGGVATFEIDRRDHSLRPLGRQKSSEGGTCHVSISADGRSVLTADYGKATLALLPTDASGIPQPPAATDAHHGHGPDPDRQKEAHAHSFYPDPSGKFALSCDLGTDEIFVYRIDAPPGLTWHSTLKIAPGSGPRHLAISAGHRFVYLVNELDNTVDVLEWDAGAGTLTHVQRVPTLPADFTAFSKAAEIAVHPNGAFVYASNRGHDSLACFHVDRDTGRLSVAGHKPVGGKEPRHFAIAPGGRFLVAANQESDNVVAFRIDAETGDLTPTGGVATVSQPVCVRFA